MNKTHSEKIMDQVFYLRDYWLPCECTCDTAVGSVCDRCHFLSMADNLKKVAKDMGDTNRRQIEVLINKNGKGVRVANTATVVAETDRIICLEIDCDDRDCDYVGEGYNNLPYIMLGPDATDVVFMGYEDWRVFVGSVCRYTISVVLIKDKQRTRLHMDYGKRDNGWYGDLLTEAGQVVVSASAPTVGKLEAALVDQLDDGSLYEIVDVSKAVSDDDEKIPVRMELVSLVGGVWKGQLVMISDDTILAQAEGNTRSSMMTNLLCQLHEDGHEYEIIDSTTTPVITQPKATMLNVNGKSYTCTCGGNVFTKLEGFSYRCNSCGAQLKGDPSYA